MELLALLLTLVAVVLVLILLAAFLTLNRERVRLVRGELRERAIIALPSVAILAAVLLVNMQFRSAAHDLSWVIGWEITPLIARVEGAHTIVYLQSLFGEAWGPFFSYMYVYGYVFLLVFPLVAYFFLLRMDTFQAISIAYAANYGIGLVCYVMFVAFGPRNTLNPELIEQYMYTTYPHFQLLTSEVNQSTNVFPSLHASLSATVMIFAWRTREDYPVWTLLAFGFGSSVVVSTMYLGIHWVVDVLAGILLALLCTWIGITAIENGWVTKLEQRTGWNRVVESMR